MRLHLVPLEKFFKGKENPEYNKINLQSFKVVLIN